MEKFQNKNYNINKTNVENTNYTNSSNITISSSDVETIDLEEFGVNSSDDIIDSGFSFDEVKQDISNSSLSNGDNNIIDEVL